MEALHKEIGESLGALTSLVQRYLSKKLREEFEQRGFDLPIEHWVILRCLWIQDGLIQQELAEAIHKDKTTVTRAVNVLEKMNILVRIPDGQDKRHKRLFLTHKGKVLQNRLNPLAKEIHSIAEHEIPEQDLATCKRVLRQIIKNLNH